MQYLGGKHRIAKEIGGIINRFRGDRPYWEPFCGALNVTAVLGPNGIASDRHPGLISLYQQLIANPGLLADLESLQVTEALYAEAKTWPDDDALKALIGFGASFGGKWFGGYAKPNPKEGHPNYTATAVRQLAKKLVPVDFRCVDFLEVQPQPITHVLYLDPPYRGTTGYKFGFDSDLFEQRARDWSQYTDVFISEYAFPRGQEIWSKTGKMPISSGNNGQALVAVERLFYIAKGSL